MDNKLKMSRLLFGLGILFGAQLACGQVAPYTKAATAVTGNWPSINNKGTMVWSQMDTSGYWQVWMTLQNSPFSGVSETKKVTSGNQNHERPVIDDNGDIVYFQDNSGQGAGWEVVEQFFGGSQSTLEFSSANPSSCKPPNDPTCVFWHTAGQNFGFAADGTTLTYFDFCSQGSPPSCERNFDVSGIGTLQCSGQPCLFYGYDYPTINSNGQIAFTDTANIYYTTTASPEVPGTLFGPGQCPHLADWISNNGLLNPQVTFVQSTEPLCSPFSERSQASASIESNLLLNATGQQVPVDSGVWASVNNSGAIVYQTETSNTSPIWFAGNTNGVDLSRVPSISWNEILTVYAPRFVIADAWGGTSAFKAYQILKGAISAQPTLDIAAYAVLNLNAGAPSPAQQMQNAVNAVGSLASSLRFMAIDLEPGLYSSSNQSQNVGSIIAAINWLQNPPPPYTPLKPVIYASSANWTNATGNDPTIGGCGAGDYCVPIWNVRSDKFPDLFDDKISGVITPWSLVGGWSGRLGKQYNDNCYKNSAGKWVCTGVPLVSGCNPRVSQNCPCTPVGQCNDAGFMDLDVFDVSLFQ